MTEHPVTIRFSRDADAAALRRLAVLDSARVPDGVMLVAEVDGELRAALAADGTAIADPFRPTAELVELLQVRLRSLGARRRATWRRTAGWRPALAR